MNLRGVTHDRWIEPQRPAPPIRDLVLEVEPFVRPSRATWSSPEDPWAGGELVVLTGEGGRWRVRLPELVVWGTVVVECG